MAHTDVLNYIQVGFHSSLLLFNNSHFAKYCALIHDKVCNVCAKLVLVLVLSLLMFMLMVVWVLVFVLLLVVRERRDGGSDFAISLRSVSFHILVPMTINLSL